MQQRKPTGELKSKVFSLFRTQILRCWDVLSIYDLLVALTQRFSKLSFSDHLMHKRVADQQRPPPHLLSQSMFILFIHLKKQLTISSWSNIYLGSYPQYVFAYHSLNLLFDQPLHRLWILCMNSDLSPQHKQSRGGWQINPLCPILWMSPMFYPSVIRASGWSWMAAFGDPTQHCCSRLCIALITVSQTHSLALLTTGRGERWVTGRCHLKF